ncbi:MAG: S8 family serine peptidase [Chloroflexi bacterium]|nr:S8 family serine peptidase [Chloroflexota bacterium]
MRKELFMVLVSLVLLIAAAIAACQKTATPEPGPTDPGYLAPTPAPAAVFVTPAPTEPMVAAATPALPAATGSPVASPGVADSGGQTPGASAGYGQSAPTPVAFLSREEWQRAAFKYISEKYNLPLSALRSGDSVGRREFPLTNVVLSLGVVAYKAGDVDRLWVVAIDQNGRTYEGEGIRPLEIAENAARVAKYGKLDPVLYDRLQTKGPEDKVRVLIAVKIARNAQVIWGEMERKYPQAYLKGGGVTKQTPMDLYSSVILPEFRRELEASGTEALGPLMEYLKARGFPFIPVPHTASVDVTLPKQVLLELERRPDVVFFHLVPGPGDIGESMDSASPTIGAPSNWERGRGLTGNGVKLGVLDRGNVDLSGNPYLSGEIVGTPDVITDHATAVAGSAAGSHPKYRSPAYQSYILSAYLAGDFANYQTATGNLMTAGAGVINHSWYLYPPVTGFQPYDRYYDWLTRHQGVINVVAAGNWEREVETPGKGYNVITVGGFWDNDNPRWKSDVMMPGSNWINPWNAFNEKPEIAGVSTGNMTITRRGGTWDQNGDWITDTAISGTSFAAPQVAGGVAMLIERDARLSGRPESVKAILVASAIHNIEGETAFGRAALVDDPEGRNRDGAGGVDLAVAYDIVNSGWWGEDPRQITMATDFDASGWYTRSSPTVQLKKEDRLRVAMAWDSVVDPDLTTDELLTNLFLYVVRLDGQGGETPVAISELLAGAVQSTRLL